MKTIQKILVGLDLSPRTSGLTTGSAKALEQAVWLARKTDARITLLHSTRTDEYHEAIGRTQEIVHEGLSQEGAQTLRDAQESIGSRDVDCTLEVVQERPWLATIYAVLRGDADIVIVGKRNEDDADGRRLGSQASKLLRKCPAPVWVVKPQHDLVHKLVLSATDLSPVGDEAIRCGAFVAQQQPCELHVVHAYQIPFELQMESARMSDEDYAERVDAIRKQAQDHVDGVLRSCELDGEPVVHIGRNSPAGAIKEAVEHLHPDLLVMGTLSRAGIAGMLVGNTAERLLDRVDCSILAVKPDDFHSPVELP